MSCNYRKCELSACFILLQSEQFSCASQNLSKKQFDFVVMGAECSTGNAAKIDSDLNNTTFTASEIKILRETFDSIKYGGQKRQLAQKSIDMYIC